VAENSFFRKWVRTTSDWVDLQWSVLVGSLKQAAPRARGRLLDVGCGNKPYEEYFRPYVSEYFGIEHESTFELTTSGNGARRPDILYDGMNLPFPDRTFETVLSVQVLEHTPFPGQLVCEMSRVLRDDGLLILVAPFQFRLHEQPHDYFRYSSHGLRHLCEAAGLEVLETHPQGGMWSVIGHKINSYLAFRVARIGRRAQEMGKLGHESKVEERMRVWTLPFVGVSMLTVALTSRVLDRLLVEPDEMMNFMILARRRQEYR
jgi:SAM-dependent methyltransferase